MSQGVIYNTKDTTPLQSFKDSTIHVGSSLGSKIMLIAKGEHHIYLANVKAEFRYISVAGTFLAGEIGSVKGNNLR